MPSVETFNCIKCNTEKTISEFKTAIKIKRGHHATCRVCSNLAERVRYSKDLDKSRLRCRLIMKKHGHKYKERAKAKIAENIEIHRAVKEVWRQNNKHRYRMYSSNRRAIKLNSTPSWNNKSEVEKIYRHARRLSLWLGEEFEVDHIVPLKSKIACGLHCESNLRIISKLENRVKNNKFCIEKYNA